MPRNAIAFETTHSSEDAKKPGAYYFTYDYRENPEAPRGEPVGIVHACPCGCGNQTLLWFKGKAPANPGGPPRPEWTVEGEWPKVSLTPSIGAKKGTEDGQDGRPYHWHGYLTKGVFTEC